MWKSVRLRVRAFSGEVNLDNSDRRVEAKGDDEVGVTFAPMLCDCSLPRDNLRWMPSIRGVFVARQGVGWHRHQTTWLGQDDNRRAGDG